MALSSTRWQAQVERALEPLPEQPQQTAVCLEAGADTIALLRLGGGVPECVRVAASAGKFCSVVQEPGAATAWVPRALLPRSKELLEKDGAEEVDPGVGWCAIRVGRPGSGKAGLKMPASPGSAGMLCALLAEVKVNARLLSAFGVEVLLVPEEALPQTAAKFIAHGHALWPSTRVCDPQIASRDKPNDPELSKQLAGTWSLVQREEPPGTVVEEFTDGDGPIRLQVPGGMFVELRVPPGDMWAELKQNSFGGRCHAIRDSGRVICSNFRTVDFQPPNVDVPEVQVTLSTSCLEVVGHPRTDEYRELWAKLGSADETDFVALELQAEVPEPKSPRCGIWLFSGTRFARILGLPRGDGLVAGTSCRSMGQLQRLRGYAEVRYELREHYEATYGTMEEPGLLKIRRMAWQPAKTDTVFYSATDESTGEIVVGQDSILHILPGGRRETWRIVEWTFNPFTPPSSELKENEGYEEEEVATDKDSSSQPTQARSHSSAQDVQEEGEAVKLQSESPAAQAESQLDADADEAPDAEESDAGGAADQAAEPPTLSPAPASPAAAEPANPAKTRPKAKAKDGKEPKANKEAKAAKKAKEGKEGKEKRKKRRKKDAAAEGQGEDASLAGASANGKAAKHEKKKKRKKVKRNRTEKEKEKKGIGATEKKAASESGDAAPGNSEAEPVKDARSGSPAAPSSPKEAGSPKAEGSQEGSPAPESPEGDASAKASPALKSPAPASPAVASTPAASPAKSLTKRSRSACASSSPAATERGRKGRVRNELNAGGRRGKKSPSRIRKKDRKRANSGSPRRSSPAGRGASSPRKRSPAGKRGASPRKRKSSPAKRSSPRRGSSPKKRGSPSRKRSPARGRSPKRRGRSGSRKGGSPNAKRSRSRGGRNARGKARSNSGRAGRGGRGDRGRSRSRSRSGGDRKKRKK